MASLSSNPSSVVSAGTWTGGANVYLSDNVFATNTGATQNTEYPLEVGGFNFAAIPAGATINSVTVTIEAKTGTAARAQIKGELLDGSTVLGTLALTNLTAADANYTFTPTATLAQLQSANLKVRVTNKRIVSQASTTSVDWVKADVVYTPIPPAVTQAGYRFYADGTETGATALAGQDTAPTVDTSGGDVNLGLRMRLQETAGGVLPASTDWRLQWEKNASGTWGGLLDGNGLSNNLVGLTSSRTMIGQSFLGDGQGLRQARFLITSNAATPADGVVTAHLYAHAGTYGTNGTPTGPILATSINSWNATTLPPDTVRRWYDFDFDGSFTLTNGTPYFVVMFSTTTGTTAEPQVTFHSTKQTSGGYATFLASWTGSSSTLGFQIYTGPLSVVAYGSPNLTDGGATTNQLTGGTGTFVAGKVSEAAVVNEFGWAASNHTELLYALTLKQAALAPSDALRFRVLKDGATTDLTYTQVPSVTIGAGGPATIQATVALTAASTLTAAAVPERAAAVTLTAASTLTTTGVPARVASVALTAVSTLTAAGTVSAPAPEVAATAALVAASTLTATGVRIPQATASLVAASTLTVTATRFGVPLATVALTGVSSLTATGVREPQAVVSLTATSTLTATAVRSAQPTVALAAASTLTVTATRFGVLVATVPLAAAGTLTATGVREPQASASLTATSTLTATGIRTQHATSALVAASQLTTGAVVARVPVVALTAVSTLTATAVRIPEATVSLTAASTLTAAATTTPAVFATVAMAAAATLTATAVREPQASASLVAASTLTATATRTTDATVPLDGISTLTVLATAGPRPAGYVDEVLTDGPTVLWLCDEAPGATTAADSSGSGKTGTAGADVTFGAAGSGLIAGYPTAATFAGTTVAANLLQVALTPLAAGATYSLELWVRTIATTGGYAIGDVGSTTGTSLGALLLPASTPAGAAGMRVWNASATQSNVLSAALINNGQPHHVVGVAEGGTMRLYLNGVLANTAAITGTFKALQSLRCGGTVTGQSSFKGNLAGAAFYPTALSAGRVAAHYAAGTAVPVVPVPATVALVASSTLAASATTTPAKFATADLTATSTLSATAVRQPQAAVSLTASSTLTATAVRTRLATVSLTATAVLTVTGVRVRVVAVALTASSSLTATPTRVRPATVPLTAAATLTVQLVRIPQAFVGMAGTSVLVATATITAAAIGIPNAAHTGFLHALDADLSWYPVTVPT